MGSERTPQAYREHFRHHLSPSVAQMAAFDEMERDLELVRRIYDTGAVHESELSWAALAVGRGDTAKKRFEQLTKRLPLDCGSLPFDELVDRLLVSLQRASENRAKATAEREQMRQRLLKPLAWRDSRSLADEEVAAEDN